jgi:hypothetical protein
MIKNMNKIFIACLLVMPLFAIAQENTDNNMASPAELPYRLIPEYPDSFTANTVAARMLDGLGFRYYWATEGLRPEDLSYRPGEDARTVLETLEHIHGLCRLLHNAVFQKPNIRASKEETLSYEELREQTLVYIKEASGQLNMEKAKKMDDYNIVFQRGEQETQYPFWNALNGPLADALWHVGQVVSFRRASGNPLNPKISLFTGTVRP